jgi:hypothetical protein
MKAAEGEDEDLLKMRLRRLPASEARSQGIVSLCATAAPQLASRIFDVADVRRGTVGGI